MNEEEDVRGGGVCLEHVWVDPGYCGICHEREPMEEKIKQGLYLHFRGDYYTVLFEAVRVDAPDELDVVYVSCKNGTIYVRSKKVFQETVTNADGDPVPRFMYLGDT